MKPRGSLSHIHFWVLFFLLFLLCGCPSLNPGTETGNPGPIANPVVEREGEYSGTETGNPPSVEASSLHVSAVPVPFDKLPAPFFSAILDIEGDEGTLKSESVTVSPKILWPAGDILFIAGADRGIQIVDLPLNGVPVLRGNLFLSGVHSDINLVENEAYVLTNNALHEVNIENRDNPKEENSTSLGANVLRIYPFESSFVRVSTRTNGYTQLDIVPENEVDQPVMCGVVLPIKAESERRYGNELWLRGQSIQNGKSYLLGIDLEQPSLKTVLLDLSDMITETSDSIIEPDQDSPVFILLEVPSTNFTDEKFDASYFDRIMQMYGFRIMEMFYGIWMDLPLYVVITDATLNVYDLNNKGKLSAEVPISFRPESFVISDSSLIFSYFTPVDPPEDKDQTKKYGEFYYTSFDLSDPLKPVVSEGINVPGSILSLKGDEILTLDFTWDEEGNFNEMIQSSQIIDNKVTIRSEYHLPQRSIARLVSGASIITVLAGDAQKWSDLIRIIDFSDPENPKDNVCDILNDEGLVGNDTCGVGVCGSPNNTPSACEDSVFTSCIPGLLAEDQEITCDDGLDNDCDGLVDDEDDGCGITCSDLDNDGYGSPGDPTCSKGSALDCDDSNDSISPGTNEICGDGIDNDCDGVLDDLDNYCTQTFPSILPPGTVLTIDQGFQGASSFFTVTYPDSTTTVYIQSSEPDGFQDYNSRDGGIILGTNQPGPIIIGSGTWDDPYRGIGSHAGSPDYYDGTLYDTGIDTGPIERPWSFIGSTGHHFQDLSAGGVMDNGDGTMNMSGWSVSWNGDTTVNMGNGPDATFSVNGNHYTLDYQTTVPEDDPSSFGGVSYRLHLEGSFCLDYVDDDGDGYACDDCDDSNPDIYPGSPNEVLGDLIDHNCDGFDGIVIDADGDGHYSIDTGGYDCNDADPNVYPGLNKQGVRSVDGVPNTCDEIDNDCDGEVDEELATYYQDADGDGYGNPSERVEVCAVTPLVVNGVNYVEDDTDCNDFSASANPGKAELPGVCDGLDNDCDGTIDEFLSIYYRDADGDGFGDPNGEIESCETEPPVIEGVSSVENYIDCNDLDSSVHPRMDEQPENGIDDNCNGMIDEEYIGLKPNHNYELRIFETPQKLQGTFVVSQILDKQTAQLNTSFTINALPGSSSNLIVDTDVNLQEPYAFGSSVGGDGYVGTIRFTTNSDASGFVGSTGTTADLQFDAIFNTEFGDVFQEYRPGETTKNSFMTEPAQMGSFYGVLGPNGRMTLVPDGRIGGLSMSPDFTGVRFNVNPDGEYDLLSTEDVTNSLGIIWGNRIAGNGDGTFSVTLVSAGTGGEDWGFVGINYVEVWRGIIVDAEAPDAN